MPTNNALLAEPTSVASCPMYDLVKHATNPLREDGHVIRKFQCVTAGTVIAKFGVRMNASSEAPGLPGWDIITMSAGDVQECVMTHFHTSSTADLRGQP